MDMLIEQRTGVVTMTTLLFLSLKLYKFINGGLAKQEF